MSGEIRVTVLGCGLVGGSVAAAAQAAGARVTIADRDASVVRRAADLGIGHHHAGSLPDAVQDADIVVVAVPVAHTAEVIASVSAVLPRGVIVTDVGSVKTAVQTQVSAALSERPDVLFVGGHPMAGSERSGVDAADALLFRGATWMLTPTADTEPERFERLAGFLRSLGARVLAVDVDLHDRLVAIASHLPQVLASTLMAEAGDAAERTGHAVLAVAGGGFRDVTRIAASEPDLWVGILRGNRAAVLDAVDAFVARLATFRAALAEQRWDAIHEALARGRTAREQLPSKERVGALVDLVVAVADRPSVLAEVTTALGEAGVNIEDLSMRHATDLEAGALVVAVDGHDAAVRARDLLERRGFSARLEPR